MTELIEVNVANLSGPALDWVVARVEAVKVSIAAPQYGTGWRVYKPNGFKYSPSTDWVIGGPLVSKYQITITYHNAPDRTPLATTSDMHPAFQAGQTILIAACRAIVAAKLGDTVQVPKELI